jgi:hypothetical protein
MTLAQFISTKPTHVRLGQWFICCYCKPVGGHWEDSLDSLWNLPDWRAENFITGLMMHWQWDELPEINGERKTK